MDDKENLPPPPVLVRQVAGPVHEPQLVDTSLQPTFNVHGQSDFSPLPDGLWGYDEDDYDNIIRNNGWWVPEGEYEEEDVTDESSDEEEEEEEDVDEIVNRF